MQTVFFFKYLPANLWFNDQISKSQKRWLIHIQLISIYPPDTLSIGIAYLKSGMLVTKSHLAKTSLAASGSACMLNSVTSWIIHQNIPKPRGFSEKKMASNQKNSGESQTFRETSIIFLIFFGSSEASRGWPLNRDNKCTAADCLLQQRTAEARLVSMSHISRHLWSLDNSETPDAAMISTTIATTSHDLWRCHDDSWWEGMVCREQHLRQKNRTQTGGILVSGAKHTCIMPPPLCSSSHEDPWVKLKDALSKSSSSSIEHTQLD